MTPMDDVITLSLAALATARLTRLITKDVIFEGPRTRLIVWMPPKLDAIAYLIQCAWCTSVYVGAAVAASWWAWGDQRWYTAAVAALAFSHITGWIAAREGKH